MKLNFKIFSILLILTMKVNIQSAGIFRIARIDNQTNETFELKLYEPFRSKTRIGWKVIDRFQIDLDSEIAISLEIINEELTKKALLSRLIDESEKYARVDLVSKNHPLLSGIHVKGNKISLSSGYPSTHLEPLPSEGIDSNYDYSINLTIKPNFKIEMNLNKE